MGVSLCWLLFYLHLHSLHRLFIGCQTSGQTGLGPSRETITKAIISSVLLQLRTVSSYISAAVLLLNQLASFNFLYALFFRSCG